MGQRLHFYASKDLEVPQFEAWADCRAKELWEVPIPGFEEDSYRAVEAMKSSLDRHPASPHQYECGSTWSVQAYPDIGWTSFVCAPEKIEEIRSSARLQMANHEGLKRAYPNTDWASGPLFDWLESHLGWNILVDHEGI